MNRTAELNSLRVLARSPLPAVLRRLNPLGVRIVLYHHVGEESAFTRRIRVTTPPETFEAHMRRLSRDYNMVGLRDLIDGDVPKRALLVTFDDAYRSVLDTAAPIANAYGAKPVFFATTSPIFEGEAQLDNLLSYAEEEAPDALADAFGAPASASEIIRTRLPGRSAAEIRELRDRLAARLGASPREWAARMRLYLTPDDLKSLAKSGFDFGCHTRSHVHVRGMLDDEMESEIAEPIRRIEGATGKSARVFSFPYGSPLDAAPKALRFMRGVGIERCFYVRGYRNRAPAGGGLFRSSVEGMDAAHLSAELEIMSLLRTAYAKIRGGSLFGAASASS